MKISTTYKKAINTKKKINFYEIKVFFLSLTKNFKKLCLQFFHKIITFENNFFLFLIYLIFLFNRSFAEKCQCDVRFYFGKCLQLILLNWVVEPLNQNSKSRRNQTKISGSERCYDCFKITKKKKKSQYKQKKKIRRTLYDVQPKGTLLVTSTIPKKKKTNV